jgi:hypothetical protein
MMSDAGSQKPMAKLKAIMKRPNSFQSRLRIGVGLILPAIFICWTSVPQTAGADPPAQEGKTSEKKTPGTKPVEATPKQTQKKKLTGAELYAMHCNRCHPERFATERSAAQWKTIMTHMRVRANLPAAQAREILKFLEADNAN